MKITNSSHTIERGSLGQESKFTIRANSRAFSILSSNLYTNKIAAVIRELSANAIDSHVAANTTHIPFDVHLPNTLEPWFSVTDYGTGLTHDQVMDIYTTYFASSKTDSNDYIGALGLGSKSPFAYTSAYDVTSIHNGVMNSYVMFIGEDGSPSVAHMGSTPTTSRNGVSVKLPVKNTDFNDFLINAIDIYTWFKFKPCVTGNNSYSIKEYKELMSGTGWKLYDRYGIRSKASVLMGNVLYPIKSEHFPKYNSFLPYYFFVIDFNIGELDVSASREELSYDDATINMIEIKLEHILKEILVVVEKELSVCKTLWDARLYMVELYKNGVTSNLFHALNNMKVSTQKFLPKWNGIVIDILSSSFADRIEIDASWFPDNKIPNISEFIKSTLYKMSDHYGRNYFRISTHSKFIKKDTFDITNRLKESSRNSSENLYVLDVSENDFQIIMDKLGNPPYILSSTLAKPERKKIEFKGHLYTGKAPSYYVKSEQKWSNWGPEKYLDQSMKEFYVTIEGATPVKFNKSSSDDKWNTVELVHFKNLINLSKQMGIIPKDTEIYGINKTNTKKIIDNPNYTEIYDFIKTAFTKIVTDNSSTLEEILYNEKVCKIWPNKNKFNTLKNKNNPVGEFLKKSEISSIKTTIDINDIFNLNGYLIADPLADNIVKTIKENVEKRIDSLKTLFNDILNQYPLLAVTIGNDSLVKANIQYIAAMDLQRSCNS